jgi:CRISPR-associated protein Cas1
LTSNSLFPSALQEPFRQIADVTVMKAFESGLLDVPDFYLIGDDYRYPFELGAKQRCLHLLRERFNSAVGYKGRAFKWDSVIEHKVRELSRFSSGRASRVDFSEPSPSLRRTDDQELRKQTLVLSELEAQKLRIAKRTLHYLRKNATSNRSFRVYCETLKRLEHLDPGAGKTSNRSD